MKKLYIAGIFLLAITTTGCTLKAPQIPAVSTGDTQTVTDKTLPVISGSEMEEFTGEIDSGVVPMLSGSDTVTAQQNGVSNEVKSLIENRKAKPSDETKLDEEDIGLFDEIIQAVKNIGN